MRSAVTSSLQDRKSCSMLFPIIAQSVTVAFVVASVFLSGCRLRSDQLPFLLRSKFGERGGREAGRQGGREGAGVSGFSVRCMEGGVGGGGLIWG